MEGLLSPGKDFEIIVIEGIYHIKYGDKLILADQFTIALWLEREKLIDRIHRLGVL